MNRRPLHPVWRRVGLVLGLALIVAAVWTALARVDSSALGRAAPLDVALLALAVVANLVLTGLLFYVITLSFDADPPVDATTMIKLISASGLLNMLPLRPGLFGRAAYLNARHRLPISQSVLTLLVTFAVGGVVLGVTALAVLLSPADSQGTAMLAALVALLIISPLTGPIAQRVLRRQIVRGWAWLPLRLADMLVGGAKLYLAFRIIGHTVPFEQALAIRAVGSLIDMVPLTPNGLGLREWGQAALASLADMVEGPIGIAASLIDRAVEAIVLVVIGLICLTMLRRGPTAS